MSPETPSSTCFAVINTVLNLVLPAIGLDIKKNVPNVTEFGPAGPSILNVAWNNTVLNSVSWARAAREPPAPSAANSTITTTSCWRIAFIPRWIIAQAPLRHTRQTHVTGYERHYLKMFGQ